MDQEYWKKESLSDPEPEEPISEELGLENLNLEESLPDSEGLDAQPKEAPAQSPWSQGPEDRPEELSTDEQAVAGSGFSKFDEMELDRIIQETLSKEFGDDPVEDLAPQPAAPVADDYYTDSPGELPPEEDPDKPKRKVRPKRKSRYGLFGIPHLVSVAIWLSLIVLIGVSLGNLIWQCATDVLAFGRPDHEVVLTISSSDTIESITQKLYENGLIKYPQLFKFYAGLSHAEKKISPGTFTLNTLYDYHAIVGGMSASSSYRATTELTIPEGYSTTQLFALLEEKGVCTVQELEAYAIENTFEAYPFLADAPKGQKNTLEGFLFPDTYEFYVNSTAKEVYRKLLGRFDDQFDEETRALVDSLNEKFAGMLRNNGYGDEYIAEHKLTVYDVITIASIIEKESGGTDENYTISSVIYNRLASKDFPYLNLDATLVYGLGKKELTSADLETDHPYNTYTREGLPPTPISNPGINSIRAALAPETTDFYYYALDPATGKHHFSKTYEEHLRFLESLKDD